jgi:hypothetical protein
MPLESEIDELDRLVCRQDSTTGLSNPETVTPGPLRRGDQARHPGQDRRTQALDQRAATGAMTDLPATIAECLSVHAEAMDRLGTNRPELDDRVDPGLREKIVRQRAKVSASLEGDPEQHRAHVESLTKGLKIVLRRLVPAKPKLPAPPLPVWDDETKAWRIPEGKDRIAQLAAQFDARGPDDPNELFCDRKENDQ